MTVLAAGASGTGKNGPYIAHAEKYNTIAAGVSPTTLGEAQAQVLITERRPTAPRAVSQHQGKPVVVGPGPPAAKILKSCNAWKKKNVSKK